MIIYGINPVLEALRAGRVRACASGARADARIDELLALARRQGVAVERVDAQALDRAARGGVHQGVVAEVEAPRDYSVEELVEAAAPAAPLIVVLDGVEDPHNVGAILRTVRRGGRARRHAAGAACGVARRRRRQGLGRGGGARRGSRPSSTSRGRSRS